MVNMAAQQNGEETIVEEEDAKELMFPKGNCVLFNKTMKTGLTEQIDMIISM